MGRMLTPSQAKVLESSTSRQTARNGVYATLHHTQRKIAEAMPRSWCVGSTVVCPWTVTGTLAADTATSKVADTGLLVRGMKSSPRCFRSDTRNTKEGLPTYRRWGGQDSTFLHADVAADADGYQATQVSAMWRQVQRLEAAVKRSVMAMSDRDVSDLLARCPAPARSKHVVPVGAKCWRT